MDWFLHDIERYKELEKKKKKDDRSLWFYSKKQSSNRWKIAHPVKVESYDCDKSERSEKGNNRLPLQRGVALNMYDVCTSKNRKPWVRTNRPLSSPAICDPDQDAAKHIRTKEEASSQHRMWGVGKHWPRHKLALNTETQLHDYMCS